MRQIVFRAVALGILGSGWLAAAEEPTAPEYTRDIAPLLKKYCAGCHNGSDHEGDLSVDTYAELQNGGEHGAAVLPGDAGSSRLIRLLKGAAEPKMPPEGEPAPTQAEIELLAAWITAGAKGPAGAEPDRMQLLVPTIPPRSETRPIAAIDLAPDGRILAVARFATVTLTPTDAIQTGGQSPAAMSRTIGEFPGKVTAVHFDGTGTRLITASGVTGLGGVAAIWNVTDGALVREFKGHRDILYDAELSPDGKILATCSYDREIKLWSVETGAELRTLSGHNGAVYDVAFSPDSSFVASASADDTCKVWRVADGERLDTLGQPLKEQYSIAFSPNGQFIVAGGADNRLRVWRFISKTAPRINPLVHARFAHEGSLLQIRFTPDGSRLVSVADDRVAKVWETRTFTELNLSELPDTVTALAVGAADEFYLGSMLGQLTAHRLPVVEAKTVTQSAPALEAARMDERPESMVSETEPNHDPATAQRVTPPVQISGTISGRNGDAADSDEYRIQCRAGEEWVVEVNAARRKSPLDSHVEVLDGGGHPVERVLLQAVRDSYFTFRGKNADETGDFRVFNWEEMELNEYLYANGEVVKLFMYPRGPDSGFNVYPAAGKRYGYFDTTPLAHALGEPCYIVEPHTPGAEIIPNGLPVFPVYFENDDESTRALGNDSKLYFTAPRDGDYLVRIRDVRGLEGDGYHYQLVIRPRQPDFRVTLHTTEPKLAPGATKEFHVSVDRIDGFDGEVSVEIAGLPPGFRASTPVVIEAGQNQAFGTLSCAAETPAPTEQNQAISMTQSTGVIRGAAVTHPGQGFGKIVQDAEQKSFARIVAAPGGAQPVAAPSNGPLEFEIAPGETIMLKVEVGRPEGKGEVSFGKEESGRNLPHGVYVDNIGLNGLLLLEGQSEREFFITAAKWVPEQSRLFHLQSGAGGGFATPPVLLHVRRKN